MNLKVFTIICFIAIYLNCGYCQENEVYKLTAENFEDSLQKFRFLYVKFYSEVCPFSRKVAPIWIEVAKILKSSEIDVAELECIKNKEICNQQNIESFPTIKLYKNGAEAGTFDTDELQVDAENIADFGKSFIVEDAEKNLREKQRSFGKCLSR